MNELRMRRRAVLAAAPLVVAAPYVARAQGKPEKPKVVLAVGGKSALYYLSLTIAEKKGFFSSMFNGKSKQTADAPGAAPHQVQLTVGNSGVKASEVRAQGDAAAVAKVVDTLKGRLGGS